MVAVIWMGTGRGGRALSSARERPISAAITAWPTMLACFSAEQKNRSQTYRFMRPGEHRREARWKGRQKWLHPPRSAGSGAPSAPRATTSGGPSTKAPMGVTAVPAAAARASTSPDRSGGAAKRSS